MAFVEDLDLFTADFGVDVSFTGSPAGLQGLLGVADQDVLDDDSRAVVVAGQRVVSVRTDAVGSLTVGAAITVDGVVYTVRHKHRYDDGAFTQIALRGGA